MIFCEAALKQHFSNKFDLTWHVFSMYHEKLCCQMSNSGQSLDIFPSTVKKNARQILVPYVHVYHLRKKAPKKSSSFLYDSWKWLRFVSFGHAKAVTDGEGGEQRDSHNWSHDVCGDEQRKNLGKPAVVRANMASLQFCEFKWLVRPLSNYFLAA